MGDEEWLTAHGWIKEIEGSPHGTLKTFWHRGSIHIWKCPEGWAIETILAGDLWYPEHLSPSPELALSKLRSLLYQASIKRLAVLVEINNMLTTLCEL